MFCTKKELCLSWDGDASRRGKDPWRGEWRALHPLHQRGAPEKLWQGPGLVRRLQNMAAFRLVQPKGELGAVLPPALSAQWRLHAGECHPGRAPAWAREHSPSHFTRGQCGHGARSEVPKRRTAQPKVTLSQLPMAQPSSRLWPWHLKGGRPQGTQAAEEVGLGSSVGTETPWTVPRRRRGGVSGNVASAPRSGTGISLEDGER